MTEYGSDRERGQVTVMKQSKNTSVFTSTDIQDIESVTLRSTYSKSGIRIIELSSLDDVLPFKKAEVMRGKWLKNNIQVKQLTNLRGFEPWTEVKGFVDGCMNVRFVPKDVLPINMEVLMFDDVVALYRVKPSVEVIIIENAAFAIQQRALFDSFWQIADPVQLRQDGSTTYGVTIERSPQEVFDFVSNLANWPLFSDFAANFERVTDTKYIAHSSQGDITVKAKFDKKKLLLDNVCTLPNGEVVMIPYRVVPHPRGAELMMTNFKAEESTKEEYDEQLNWMKIELNKAKQVLELK